MWTFDVKLFYILSQHKKNINVQKSVWPENQGLNNCKLMDLKKPYVEISWPIPFKVVIQLCRLATICMKMLLNCLQILQTHVCYSRIEQTFGDRVFLASLDLKDKFVFFVILYSRSLKKIALYILLYSVHVHCRLFCEYVPMYVQDYLQ